MAKKKPDTNSNKNGATLGFEATLYQAADKLRNNMDAAEYQKLTDQMAEARRLDEVIAKNLEILRFGEDS